MSGLATSRTPPECSISPEDLQPSRLKHRAIVVCSFAIGCLIQHVAFAQPVLRLADEQFLRQLTERRFFDLAEEHCLREFGRASDIDRKAWWQLSLCRIYEQHAWFADSASRGGLLNQSVEKLAEFLTDNAATAEHEFDLRLQQIRTLTQSVRMAIIQAEAGNLFGKTPAAVADRIRPQQKVTVDRAIQLTEGMMTRLEEVRRDLDSIFARDIRDACRIALAELHAIRFQLNANQPLQQDDADRTAGELLANQTIRSASRPQQKRNARWLLAELSLTASNHQQFELLIGAAKRKEGENDLFVAEFLQIRNLLRKQEATAAFNLASETSGRTALQIQQLEWLKLEATLGFLELASQLNDEPLIRTADQAFQKQLIRTRQTNAGVFRDAAETTIRRYDLIQSVGTKIADLTEEIDRERATGNASHAFSLLEQALSQLSDEFPRARAALLLRAGEILIERKDWVTARQNLRKASELFEFEKQTSQQAVSDILQIYAQAQIWSQSTHDQAEQKQRYVSALESHIRRFPQGTTTNRARAWLLQVIESVDAVRATSLAMDIFDSAPDKAARMKALQQAGELLSPFEGGVAVKSPELLESFRKRVAKLENDPGKYSIASVATIRLCLLEFDLATADVSDANWSEFDSRLSAIGGDLPDDLMTVHTSDAAVENSSVQLRWSLLDGIIAARQPSNEERQEVAERRLQDLEGEGAIAAIKFLSQQLKDEQINAGDVWLARLNQQLISKTLDEKSETEQQQFALQLLPHVVRAARVTGEDSLRSRVLGIVFTGPLNGQQMATVVDAISSSASSKVKNNGGDTATLSEFWRTVIRKNKQGTEPWLEAWLQLATIAAGAGKTDEARQQLDVTQALYPDWGTPARRKRVEDLQKSLQK